MKSTKRILAAVVVMVVIFSMFSALMTITHAASVTVSNATELFAEMKKAGAGDTIELKSGTYTCNIFPEGITASGTKEAPITIKAAAGATVNWEVASQAGGFDSQKTLYFNYEGITFKTVDNTYFWVANYGGIKGMSFKNCKFTQYTADLVFHYSEDISFINCEFSAAVDKELGTGEGAPYGQLSFEGCENILIEKCTINPSGFVGIAFNNIGMKETEYKGKKEEIKNVVIKDNMFNMFGPATGYPDGFGGGSGIVSFAAIQNVLIEGNTIKNYATFFAAAGAIQVKGSNMIIRNNYIIDSMRSVQNKVLTPAALVITTGSNDKNGPSINGANTISVYNNTIMNNLGPAIRFDAIFPQGDQVFGKYGNISIKNNMLNDNYLADEDYQEIEVQRYKDGFETKPGIIEQNGTTFVVDLKDKAAISYNIFPNKDNPDLAFPGKDNEIVNNVIFNPSKTAAAFGKYDEYKYYMGTPQDKDARVEKIAYFMTPYSLEDTEKANTGIKDNIGEDPIMKDYLTPYQNAKILNTGAFLTEVVSVDGKKVGVKDAKYFTNGFGVDGITGDKIVFTGTAKSEAVVVESVDYETNVITFKEDAPANVGDKVSLDYEGSAPDIGAVHNTPLTTDGSPRPTGDPTPTPPPTDPTDPTTSQEGPDFTDVIRGAKEGEPGHHWAIEWIYELSDAGVINGFDDGTFKPDDEITRAQYVQMLTKAFGIYDKNATCPEFTDVESGSWYEAAVASAKNSKITSGKTDTTFEPGSNMTRQEMMTLTARALKELKSMAFPDDAKVTELLEKFVDKNEIAIFPDFKESIALNVEQGIVGGSQLANGDWMMYPGANIKRGEVAKILAGAIGK